MGGGQLDLRSWFPSPDLFSNPFLVFNFSANNLFLLSADGISFVAAVFLFEDHDTKRVYRLYDFTKVQLIQPHVAYCVAGKVFNRVPTNSLPCDRIGPPRHQTTFDVPLFLILLTAREGLPFLP